VILRKIQERKEVLSFCKGRRWEGEGKIQEETKKLKKGNRWSVAERGARGKGGGAGSFGGRNSAEGKRRKKKNGREFCPKNRQKGNLSRGKFPPKKREDLLFQRKLQKAETPAKGGLWGNRAPSSTIYKQKDTEESHFRSGGEGSKGENIKEKKFFPHKKVLVGGGFSFLENYFGFVWGGGFVLWEGGGGGVCFVGGGGGGFGLFGGGGFV